MGSRAIVIVCRNEDAARRVFGVVDEGFGACFTRTGRRFFDDQTLEHALLTRTRDAVENVGLFDRFTTDWLLLDCELMPWSAKAQELVSLADLVMSGGNKMLVFTFFAHTVLPVLVKRLGDRPVFTYDGSMTRAERDHQITLFKACKGGAVLLSSDAGSKGLNVPEANVIAEYEPAGKFSTRVQRSGRGHRLGRLDPLTFITFVLESSIENTSNMTSVLTRNADQDFMLHDDEAEDYFTADDRRELYAQARPRKAA